MTFYKTEAQAPVSDFRAAALPYRLPPFFSFCRFDADLDGVE